MIPADVVSRTQVSADLSLRPVAPTQEITDKLSGLAVGQRIMAEIQALLPNGTYRALVNQRNITLALPFSAKSGDALELEVTESDGELSLAVIAHKAAGGGAAKESVSTTLSRTGQLIGELFSKSGEAGGGTKALLLNGNQPIAGTAPGSAQDILPLLKEAIARSGMFYESHQAEWVAGRFPKAALLQEPQGTLSQPAAFQEAAENAATQARIPHPQAGAAEILQGRNAPAAEQTALQRTVAEPAQNQVPGQLVAPQVQSLVHHQLEALASQNFVWQGQIWPGQNMRWEIEEDARHGAPGEEEAENPWNTRLNLVFPNLGGINARISLQGGQIALSIQLDSERSLSLIQASSGLLRQQLADAGLSLTSIGIAVQPPEPTE